MVLADTSVWIEHLRHGDPNLRDLLSEGKVLMHSYVRGELACGNLKNRATILSYLSVLPAVTLASNSEVLQRIEDRRLWRRGLGRVDAHLIASALLSRCEFWTLDTRLANAATGLGL